MAFNAGNQMTTAGYSYDAAGNLTAKPGVSPITDTPADQLASVQVSGVTYTYKHAGTHITEVLNQVTANGIDFQYAYGRSNAQGLPTVDTVTRTAAGITQLAAVTSDPVTGQPLLLRTPSKVQALYIYDGRAGSPIALVTSNGNQAFGYAYDPFGVPVLTQGGSPENLRYNPWFAPELAREISVWIRPHLAGPPQHTGGSGHVEERVDGGRWEAS